MDDNTKNPVRQQPAAAFRRRMWLILAGAVALAILGNAPQIVHELLMKRQIDRTRIHAIESLVTTASTNEAMSWLKSHGYQYWVSGGLSTAPIVAERTIASGTAFWRPASVRLTLHFDTSRRCTAVDAELWPFDLGTPRTIWNSGTVAKQLFIAPWIALAYITIQVGRRAIRSANKYCVDCGYNLRGIEPGRCPECGTKSGADTFATASKLRHAPGGTKGPT